ncbi:MAG: Nucleosomal histone H3-Lys79 methylase [Caeruleum heppii]|nr:MAG: Nucleosomal histone H3-Lys79 methylase [Caeruleum heppii]
MGFFDHFHTSGGGAIKPQQSIVRKEVIKAPAPSTIRKAGVAVKPLHGSIRTHNARPAKQVDSLPHSSRTTTGVSTTGLQSRSKPQVSRKRRIAHVQRLSSTDEDDDSDESLGGLAKKAKPAGPGMIVDLKRKIRSKIAFSEEDGGNFQFVQAATIASTHQPKKFAPAFGDESVPGNGLELQYPSASRRERYDLVHPRESDDFNPIQDILQVAHLVAQYYLTPSQAEQFLNEETGLLRRMRRAAARRSEQDFREAVESYNTALMSLKDKGVISENLENCRFLPLPLVEHILTQIYARTVSLKVDSLRKYENGTDNVYGELLPRFVSKIFQETSLKSDQIFVDLGSGVANVTLQAALQIGCESWGCEMMDNACDLAELQEKEFASRCRLWGLAPGTVHLERGDFLTNTAIGKILQKADVVLVNNQAFTPSLNNGLMNLFLDLKEGCQIVSLKSFVPHDHKITTRNINSPVNLLEVQSKEYYSNCVSWTNAPGTYFIATKNNRKLREFERRHR